uniref:nicotinate-nucleotide diphosphorylase (carboxylating) n=2 Tax=Aegilops tauschii subsp. strangulata TaxID=200361 RepID=A0A453LKX7_AEGTS
WTAPPVCRLVQRKAAPHRAPRTHGKKAAPYRRWRRHAPQLAQPPPCRRPRMTPATPTAAAPIRQHLPSSSARCGNPRPSARLRLPARPRAAPSASMSAEARPAPSPVPPPAHPTYDLSAVIALALSEDAGDRGDVSCLATIPTDVKAEATFIAKEDGVIAGISLAEMIFNQVDPSLKVEWFEADGNYVHKGLQFGKVYGCAQSIIVAERVVLNFMQRMSGIATMTKGHG